MLQTNGVTMLLKILPTLDFVETDLEGSTKSGEKEPLICQKTFKERDVHRKG